MFTDLCNKYFLLEFQQHLKILTKCGEYLLLPNKVVCPVKDFLKCCNSGSFYFTCSIILIAQFCFHLAEVSSWSLVLLMSTHFLCSWAKEEMGAATFFFLVLAWSSSREENQTGDWRCLTGSVLDCRCELQGIPCQFAIALHPTTQCLSPFTLTPQAFQSAS